MRRVEAFGLGQVGGKKLGRHNERDRRQYSSMSSESMIGMGREPGDLSIVSYRKGIGMQFAEPLEKVKTALLRDAVRTANRRTGKRRSTTASGPWKKSADENRSATT